MPTADPTRYLQPSTINTDLVDFGVPGATPDQVFRASRLVDAVCRRARWGLTTGMDYNGMPAFMPNAVPVQTWTIAGGIPSGTLVELQLQVGPVQLEMIGESLTVDAGTSTCEVLVIVDVNTPSAGMVHFQNVGMSHAADCVVSRGLQIFEERYLPPARSLARVAMFPVTNVLAALGRYSYGRHSQQIAGDFSEFNLLAILQNFGGPPAWIPINVSQLGINVQTGEMWVPAGVLLAYYSDFRVWYVAGWPITNLHPNIKQATANIIRNNAVVDGAGSLFKTMKGGDASLERFADRAVDDETRGLLKPFRASLLF